MTALLFWLIYGGLGVFVVVHLAEGCFGSMRARIELWVVCVFRVVSWLS
jgi:hypothetical protein